MPEFHYQAIDSLGNEQIGRVEAASAEQAAASLKGRGLHPTEIKAATSSSPSLAKSASRPRPSQAFSFLKSLTAREVALFTRQLATLLRAGMPLLRALEVLDRQEKNARMKELLRSLSEGIRSGGTLSDAMARHGRVFDRLYINMVRAGEAGGALDLVFERLAGFQEKSQQLRGKVRAAMVYPLVVLAVAASILAGLLVFVVPKFKQIFADLLKGAPLPPLTRGVLAVSEGARAHWIVLLVGASVCGLVYHVCRRHPLGRRVLDRLVLRLPVFGELALKTLVARFSRTLGTLLSSGVPVLQALTIARDTCGNLRVAGAIGVVHDRVKEGEPMARPLEGTQVFPPMVPSLIEVGEHTGQLPEMLGKVADIFDGEVDTAVAGLSSLLEPVMVVFLATVVGVIVVALFLPLVRIVQLMS